jgi:hypothetical protein
MSASNQQKYSYREYNFINHSIITPILKPVMDLFGYKKVTHWFDWQEISPSKVNNNKPLFLEGETNNRKLNQTYSIQNALASLGSVKKSAIIKPHDYNGNWSLIYCIDGQCMVNKLKYNGEVKVLVDNTVNLYAYTEENNVVNLNLVRLIDRNQEMDILHI